MCADSFWKLEIELDGIVCIGRRTRIDNGFFITLLLLSRHTLIVAPGRCTRRGPLGVQGARRRRRRRRRCLSLSSQKSVFGAWPSFFPQLRSVFGIGRTNFRSACVNQSRGFACVPLPNSRPVDSSVFIDRQLSPFLRTNEPFLRKTCNPCSGVPELSQLIPTTDI